MKGVNTKKSGLIRSFLVAICTFVFLTGLFVIFEEKTVENNKERYRYIAANQTNILKDSVDTAIARVYTFSALVRDNEGDTRFFDTAAEKIYQEIVVDSNIPIKNVAVAPNGIVEKVYPLSGNETFIGFDFMDTSKEGNSEAVEAYLRGEVILTNPFELVQGGIGMAARLPVFIQKDSKEEFWGLVTVTMDYEDMLESFHFSYLEDQGINYCLWYADGDGRVIIAESSNLPDDAVTCSVRIQNLIWNLDVEHNGGWIDKTQLLAVLLAIVVITISLAFLVFSHCKVQIMNERLCRIVHMDALTECYSRQYVNAILINQSNGSWNDAGAKYSLAVIDIDSFKQINDSYGHEVGDRALIAVAQILKEHIRNDSEGCVIRHGGDEFTVLWNSISKSSFEEKLKSIVEKIKKISFPDCPDLQMSVSAGGEAYCADNPLSYYVQAKEADKKLYMAKRNGRSQYVI